jgi:hypothetical protein
MDINFNGHLWKLMKKMKNFKKINLKDISLVVQAWVSYWGGRHNHGESYLRKKKN